MNPKPKTVSELFVCIKDLAEEERKGGRAPSLEVYLRAFYGLVLRESRTPSYAIYLEMCTAAFCAEPVDYDESWEALAGPPELEEDDGSKEPALETLGFMIADLRRMQRDGTLLLGASDLYGGVSSPSGHRWFNFDACSFIRCSAAGAESICGEDARVEFESICWSEVASFLDLGRIYE